MQGQQVESVFHVDSGDPWTVDHLTSMAQLFKDWWNGHIKTIEIEDVSLNSILATDLSTETGASIEYTTGMPIPGTGSGTALPNNVALAIHWSSGLRGRSYNGRTYHFGLVASMVVGSTMYGPSLTAIEAAYQALLTAVNATADNLCVLSRYHNKAKRTEGIGTEILSLSIDATVDSQRRRLPGRGR
jgi:hypothetical protein